MELGMIGLGRMGGNMTRRLLRGGHRVVVFDPDPEAASALAADGAVPADSIDDMVGRLSTPRAVWTMVPAGEPTEATLDRAADLLSPGDVVIDGGNSNYKDSARRAAALERRGIHLLDVGTSGGVWGLTEGYCMMIGGDREQFERLLPVFSHAGAGRRPRLRPHGAFRLRPLRQDGPQRHRVRADAGPTRRASS